MAHDDRDILEVLEHELEFVETGGYRRSVHSPGVEKSIFQDSMSCLNYGYPYRAHPCNECGLLDFVAPEHKTEVVPCHFIALNDSGETIEDLEAIGSQTTLQQKVKCWLGAKINALKEARANQTTGL